MGRNSYGVSGLKCLSLEDVKVNAWREFPFAERCARKVFKEFLKTFRRNLGGKLHEAEGTKNMVK